LAAASVILTHNPWQLAFIWMLGAVPLLIITNTWKTHLRFLALVVLPMGSALFLIWAVIMGAKPGDLPHTSPRDGAEFATLIILRLILLGGIFQIGILSLGLDGIGPFCLRARFPQEVSVMLMGATILIPEMKIRAAQIFDARCARGLLRDRSLFSRARQLPVILRALVSWALRSAIDRAEMWNHRRMFTAVQQLPTRVRPSDVVLVTLPGIWLVYSIAKVFVSR